MLQIKPIFSSLMRSKSGPLLLLLQIILSVAIVANASFIIHERLELMARESGMVESEVLSFRVYNFDPGVDLKQQNQRDEQILLGLEGVIDSTSTNMVPLSGSGWMDRYVDGPDEETAKSTPGFAFYLGNEHMLATLGLTLVEGRNFYPEEIQQSLDAKGKLAIVSKPLAEAFWGDESPVGKVMYQSDSPIEIIGVVERMQGAWVDHRNFEYSVIQNVDFGGRSSSSGYLVRTSAANIEKLKPVITQALLADNPNRVIDYFKTLREYRQESYSNHALMVAVLSLMVVLLLLITSLGLAGMVMFNVERRTKQIGTRRALGGKKRDIISYFLVENYLICLAGGGIGALLALQLGQQLMKLYSLPQLNPIYPAATVLGLFLVTTLAVIIPARRAANISPALATRSI